MIQRLKTLALIAIKEAIGRKVIYISALFALAVILISRIFTFITPGAEAAFMTDMGLTTISFLGGVIALFLASDFIPDEVRKKTIYTVLTYPVRRFEFILGKFFGVAGVLLISHFLMSVIFLAALSVFGAEIKADLIIALALIYGTLIIFSSIIITGSIFLSPLINVVFSLFFYLLGHLVVYIRHLSEWAGNSIIKFSLTFLSNIIPDLQRFEVKDKLVVGTALSQDITLRCFSYALLYSACIMMMAYVFFNEREV